MGADGADADCTGARVAIALRGSGVREMLEQLTFLRLHWYAETAARQLVRTTPNTFAHRVWLAELRRAEAAMTAWMRIWA